jgi:hypothetical protein
VNGILTADALERLLGCGVNPKGSPAARRDS